MHKRAQLAILAAAMLFVHLGEVERTAIQLALWYLVILLAVACPELRLPELLS